MNATIPLPVSCPDCDARMPESAAFCPGCGRLMPAASITVVTAHEKVGFLPENIAGALAYFTFVPAIVFLLRKPYSKNRFVRFHSIQCLLFWASGALVALALKVAGLLLFIIPVVGPLFTVLALVLVGLAAVVVWLVLVVKAMQGEMFKLPALGNYAEQQADAVQA
jgi:uncharacterized membrane protein